MNPAGGGEGLGGVPQSPSRVRLLVVEDDEQFRGLLVLALRMAGYSVDEAGTAEDGLDRLTRHRYRLVLSDYMLPGRTGAWMLEQASRSGVLQDTPAVVMTSHPDPPAVAGASVMAKPTSFDDLLTQIGAILSTPGTAPPPPAAGVFQQVGASALAVQVGPVELILYTSPASVSSARALAKVREVLARCPDRAVELIIHDLSADPSPAEPDRIAFTPTLVKRSPGPRTWIIGDFENGAVLEDLLRLCGVELS